MAKLYDWKLIVSLVCIAFFWGTTYLGIRIGVESISPLLVVGLRNILSGSVLLVYLLAAGKFEKISRERLLRNIAISVMLLVFGNGLMTFSEQYISSGLASLVATLSPLSVLLINLLFRYERASWRIFLGVLLGIFGMVMLYQSNIKDLFRPEYRLGIITMLLSVLTWSGGTVISKRLHADKENILVNLSLQMLFAGILLTSCQLLFFGGLHADEWTLRSELAVLYLAIFGSVVGYVAYMYALSKLPSTKVSVVTYINVVVALFLGWLILDETVTMKTILAACLIVGGVVVANSKKSEKPETGEVLPKLSKGV